MTTLDDFPGAPHGSWISEDGWLVIGDEAWTVREWAARSGGVGMGLENGRPVLYDDEYHRRKRDQKRRRYAARRAA